MQASGGRQFIARTVQKENSAINRSNRSEMAMHAGLNESQASSFRWTYVEVRREPVHGLERVEQLLVGRRSERVGAHLVLEEGLLAQQRRRVAVVVDAQRPVVRHHHLVWMGSFVEWSVKRKRWWFVADVKVSPGRSGIHHDPHYSHGQKASRAAQ